MATEQEPPGVVVLYNVSERLVKGEPQDLLADRCVIQCAQSVSDALRSAGWRVAQVPIHTDVEAALMGYSPAAWSIFNLGEGLEGRLFEEARIAWALEAMGYRFTGSPGDAIALSVHKARAKTALEAAGVPTPPWWVFAHPDELDDDLLDALPFPLIVKPVAEDGSLGIGPDAVVHTGTALRDRVAYIAEQYRQAALAEVFIVGREFNVALWGEPPELLPISEIDLTALPDPYGRFLSFTVKWDVNSFEHLSTPVVCPAPVESELGEYISLTARQAWTAIGCRGYARVDLRVSSDGTPYVMEVNCNPDLSTDAGFYRAVRAAGHSYEDMTSRILELALRQPGAYDRKSRTYRWRVHLAGDGSHPYLQSNGGDLRRRTVERVSRQG
jgi:D-alanine-D-alanine ligase